MFSPRNFTATGLMFKPLMHFELIFVSNIRQGSNVIFLYVVVLFISTQEETSISPLGDTGSHQVGVDFARVYYIWATYSASLFYVVFISMPVPYCFNYYRFVL